MARMDFDPNAHQPREDNFEPLPPDWYAMQGVKSDVKETKNKDGGYLELVLEVLEDRHPQLKGRKVFARFNLWNQNQQTVKIAEETLTALCKSIGVNARVTDSEVLHHKPVAVKVKVRPAKDGYDASNDVVTFKPIGERFGIGAPQNPATMSPGLRGPQQAAPQTAWPGRPSADAPPPQQAPAQVPDQKPW